MQSTNTETPIMVFAKAPQPGAAKTRLIPLIGAEGAARFHASMVKHTLGTALNARIGPVELHCAPDTQDAFFSACAGRYRVMLYPQIGVDLGARMQRAFEQGIAGHRRAIVIGCDCPLLKTDHLRAAHAALTEYDAVLIPSEDGGYALIGLARCDALLFENIEWGAESVLETTRERLRKLGWRWQELETLWDIDRPEDYARWQAVLRDYAKPFTA
jgi:rSAM/selenodomain-associated transferase 1